MAQATSLDQNLFSIDPSLPPGYMNMPAQAEATPMPYSPEGWQASKLMPQGESAAPTPEAGKKKEKGKDVGFTPEQMVALNRMVSVEQRPVPNSPAANAPAAPRNQVAPMQQATLPGQGASAPRASLGQIIYGGRKF